ncbi:MAG: hypothetical protein LBR32_06940 [Propionibacteriaceae bacterium]|jgi:hypothetical protein|nr:hypothetical protein [Propionibacteriaceae bacterium]
MAQVETSPRGFALARWQEIALWAVLLTLLSVIVGALVGLFWANVVTLPAYTVGEDGSATIPERGLVAIFGMDVWYGLCALLVGPGLGLVAWRWFRPLGWASALLAAFSALVAGWACWWLGEFFGPGPFDERIAAASPGDVVPLAVELHGWPALLLWPFAALALVLVVSTFSADPQAGEGLGGDVGEPPLGGQS